MKISDRYPKYFILLSGVMHLGRRIKYYTGIEEIVVYFCIE